MKIDKDCFSEMYRTRDGLGFFTFHFQRREACEWWFSYRQSQSYHASNEEFLPADVLFKAETYDELRQQAGTFAESLHTFGTERSSLAFPPMSQ